MITLHLLEYLRLQGFGTAIETDLHWEKLPLDKTGVAIYAVGGEQPYGGRRKSQLFELISRGTSDLLGADRLEKIAEHFADTFVLCDLPTVPELSNKEYKKCSVFNVSNVQNLGLDANDRVLFKLTAQVIYNK